MSQALPTRAKVAAILLAGGSGNRMQGRVSDKVLLPLRGKPLVRHSIDAFTQSRCVDTLLFVYRDLEQRAAIEAEAAACPLSLLWALGGRDRQDSVWAGLRSLPATTEIVLIHDCARPLVSAAAIRASVEAVKANGIACVAHKTQDTIKQVRPSGNNHIPSTLDRSTLWSMETPQSFKYPLIRDAYRKVIEEGRPITDDLSAIEDLQLPVSFIDNGRANPKLTTPRDIPLLEFLSQQATDNPA